MDANRDEEGSPNFSKTTIEKPTQRGKEEAKPFSRISLHTSKVKARKGSEEAKEFSVIYPRAKLAREGKKKRRLETEGKKRDFRSGEKGNRAKYI